MKNKSIATIALAAILTGNMAFASLTTDFKTNYQAGEAAFAKKNYKLAVDSFAEAVKLAPEKVSSRYRLGQSLFSLGNYAESYSQFQAILQTSPNNISARVFLSENLVKLGRTKEAQAHLSWILKIQPGQKRAAELLNQCTQSTVNPQTQAKITNQKEQPTLDQGPEVIPAGFEPIPMNNKVQEVKPFKAESGQQISKKNTSSNSSLDVCMSRMPEAVAVKSWDASQFLQRTGSSFGVNLEYARFCLEKGDVELAKKHLNIAEKIGADLKNPRRMLEIQILKSLALVYQRDFDSFGKHLFKLKSILSKQSYNSFLDIYNKATMLTDKVELSRLAGGVAMGAGHFAVASEIFSEVALAYPDDLLVNSILAEAQIQNLDFDNAEKTLNMLARNHPENAEAYFNLGRFYLTAKFRPDYAKRFASYAKKLNPNDARFSVLLALVDYSQGKIDVGIERIKQLLPQIKDAGFATVCKKIIADGEYAHNQLGSKEVDFAQILALPGAAHAPVESFKLLGDDALKRGSFFTALKFYLKSRDVAEVGRTYLGIASSLANSGELEASALAAGFGVKALDDVLAKNPFSGRANLYKALYAFERNDLTPAKQAIEKGLRDGREPDTKRRLTSLLNKLKS